MKVRSSIVVIACCIRIGAMLGLGAIHGEPLYIVEAATELTVLAIAVISRRLRSSGRSRPS